MKKLKKQGRPHDLYSFERVQVEKITIACDDVLSVACQGARQYSEIIGITQFCRDNSWVLYQQRGVLDQSDQVMDILRRKAIPIF
jgi:hypothetical protein